MKISCERERLLSSFQVVAMVAPSRSPRPILQNVKIETKDDKIILSATDMELGVRSELTGVTVEAPGSALVPVTRFGSILRESSDERLDVAANDQGITVKGLHSNFELPAGNPNEFPVITPFDEERYHKISARLLKELIRRTAFATDTESSRYALGGILLEMGPDNIIAVGTDGRRLAKMEGPAESVNGHETGESMIIVPTRSMQVIERALVDGEAEVLLSARGNDVVVKMPYGTINTRLVEGRFPKWREVLPTRRDAVCISLTVGPFYSALRQAAIVADDESRGIDFTFSEGTLTLTGSTAEVGESLVELPITYQGETLTVSLDNRFVAEFLKVLDPEKTVMLELEDEDSAALFTTDDGYGYVVMPLARDH